jgi:hypothetical protein
MLARPVVSGAIVPPLTVPIVPPFGSAAANHRRTDCRLS